MKKVFDYIIIISTFLFLLSCSSITNQTKGNLTKEEDKLVLLPQFVKDEFQKYQSRSDEIKSAFGKGKIFYYKSNQEYGLYSKSFNNNDEILISKKGWMPRLSIDQTKVFTRLLEYDNPTGKTTCYIVSFSKNGETNLLFTYDGVISYYDVSPNEDMIAFCTKDEKDPKSLYQIYLVTLKDKQIKQLTKPDMGGVFPIFSSDNKHLAFIASRILRIVDLKNGEEKKFADDKKLKEIPNWSPDGKYIVYQAKADEEKSYNIYKLKVETGEIEQLTKTVSLEANPCFDSSGEKIVFVISDEADIGNQTLAMMNADGSNIKKDATSPTKTLFPDF